MSYIVYAHRHFQSKDISVLRMRILILWCQRHFKVLHTHVVAFICGLQVRLHLINIVVQQQRQIDARVEMLLRYRDGVLRSERLSIGSLHHATSSFLVKRYLSHRRTLI